MTDPSRANQELIEENSILKQKIKELEHSETERRRAAEALRLSEENFRHSVDDSPLGVRIVTAEGETIFANRAILDIYGYDSLDELKTTPLKQRYTPESFSEYQIRKEKRKRGGNGPSEYEISIVRKGGEVRNLQVFRKQILWNGESQFQVIYDDITDRRQVEEALRESEALFSNYLENAPDGVYMNDMEGNFLYGNRKSGEIIGYRSDDLIGKNFLKLNILTEDSLSKAVQLLQANIEGQSTGPDEIELINKEGRTIPVEINTTVVQRMGQRIVLAFARDITERKKAEKKLQDTLESLRKAFGTTIQVMVSAVEARDPYTAGHQNRSADLARAIATEMGLPQEKIDGIRMAGSIHDIGKLSIPSEILSKPTKLTNVEFSLIKEHSKQGYEILKDVESPWPLAQIVYQHHKRMDGSGYPRNLKGDDILMEARIMAVADVVESMASHRPYRPGLGIDIALEEIENNKGTLYDADAVDACLRLFREKGYKLEGN
jgi:PAS domain S-box-containing protein